jgi:hypothetical protein
MGTYKSVKLATKDEGSVLQDWLGIERRKREVRCREGVSPSPENFLSFYYMETVHFDGFWNVNIQNYTLHLQHDITDKWRVLVHV